MKLINFLNGKKKKDSQEEENLSKEISSRIYTRYSLNKKERKEYYLLSVIGAGIIAYLFYDSFYVAAALSFLSVFFEPAYEKYLCEKRKNVILEEFKDALYVISSSVASGRQIPRAIKDAYENAEMFYGDKSIVYSELKDISERYEKSNMDIYDMFFDFAERTAIDEIRMFAKACSICSKSGGDIEKVCLKSALMLIEKIEFSQEAKTILSEKKLDSLILIVLPVAVLFFLNLSSYEYIHVLYTGIKGRIIMTSALLLMAAAVFWSLRIMKIDL